MPRVTIIGAGLAGSLLAIYLARRRGLVVDVYEARGDMRREEVAGGRSINLALSDRGIAALREVGMDEYVLAEAVPMYGRMIHTVSGETKLLPYSGRQGEHINSVSRTGLNIALINRAEKYDGVRFHFNERCIGFDCGTGRVRFEDGNAVSPETVIATDGAGSAIRQAMEGQLTDFVVSSVFLEHGYKELHIPPSPSGEFLLGKNALHIWPRHQFMMIALPNFDGSYTCTLFLAHKSSPPYAAESTGRAVSRPERGVAAVSADGAVLSPAFDQLEDDKALLDFFTREFPDAVPLMPTLVEDFFENPIGELGTVKCWPWQVDGRALLLGDAAHAMVPFYGQGMNCAFEDVRVLDSLIEKHGHDRKAVFDEFARERKPNADAICDMAQENFLEMRDATADSVFQRKRELETRLEQAYADYFSKYSMVTFREDLPYSIAKMRGNAQDALLMQICSAVEAVDELDIKEVMLRIRKLQ